MENKLHRYIQVTHRPEPGAIELIFDYRPWYTTSTMKGLYGYLCATAAGLSPILIAALFGSGWLALFGITWALAVIIAIPITHHRDRKINVCCDSRDAKIYIRRIRGINDPYWTWAHIRLSELIDKPGFEMSRFLKRLDKAYVKMEKQTAKKDKKERQVHDRGGAEQAKLNAAIEAREENLHKLIDENQAAEEASRS